VRPPEWAPRSVHKLWAELGGYFWMPCPVCGRLFGGHENDNSLPHSTLWLGPSTGQVVCTRCIGSVPVIQSEKDWRVPM